MLAFFTERLAFRIDQIAPADRPDRARLSGYGLRLALETGPDAGGRLRITGGGLAPETLSAPNGVVVEIRPRAPPGPAATFAPTFHVSRENAGAAEPGRAGMVYRDLVPGRLGGVLIASQITVPAAGPVADWVHYHEVAFQLIVCRRGRVRVVYEDQGPPFWLGPGDLVLQPPRIRHRVLESEGRLEVIEIGAPAAHDTMADHELVLPNGEGDPARRWGGQRFLRHRAADAPWSQTAGGLQRQETGLYAASGIGDAVYLRGAGGASLGAHAGEAALGVVFAGAALLEGPGGPFELSGADVFVAPPEADLALTSLDPDFVLLLVTVKLD